MGSLIWKDAERILETAARLRNSDQVIECRLGGSSMESAIPRESRLRVGLDNSLPFRVGEVIAFVEDSAVFVHRVVYQGVRPHTETFVVTQGDACLCPDPPLRADRVLGRVTLMKQDGDWSAIASRPAGVRADSTVSRVLLRLVCRLMEVNISVAKVAARLITSIFHHLPHDSPVGGFALKPNPTQSRPATPTA